MYKEYFCLEILLSFGAGLDTITYLSIAELTDDLLRKDRIVLAGNMFVMFTKLLHMKTYLKERKVPKVSL